jgi:hypothetical protein
MAEGVRDGTIFCPKTRRPTNAGQVERIVGRGEARAVSAIDTKNTEPVRLYVPLRIFGCLQRGFWGPDCCKLFQTVAETDLTAQIVAGGFKLLQSVAKH